MKSLFLVLAALIGMTAFSGVSIEERYRIMVLESDFPQAINAAWQNYEEENTIHGKGMSNVRQKIEHRIAKEAVGIVSNTILWSSQKMVAYYRMEIFKQKMGFILNERLSKFSAGLNRDRNRISDLNVSRDTARRMFIRTFHERFLDTEDGQKLVEEVRRMEINSEEFTDWYLARMASKINSTFNRKMVFDTMEYKERTNWIYRYATIQIENRKDNQKMMMKRGAKSVPKPAVNEDGKPPVKLFRASDRPVKKVNYKATRQKNRIKKVK